MVTCFTVHSWKGHGQGTVFIVQCEQGHGQGTYFYNLQWQGHGQGTYYFFPQLVDDEDYLKQGWWRSVDDEY